MTNIGLLGNPSTWALGQRTYIPHEFQLPFPKNGIRIVKRDLKRPVDTATVITPNTSEIRWKIPSSSVITLDFRRGCVYVTIDADVSAPWNARFVNFLWNIFTRIRFEQHGQYIDDRQFYNYQETFMFWAQALENQFTTTAEGLYGAGSHISRNTKAAGWEYALPIPTEILTKSVLPWFQLLKAANGTYSSATLPDVTAIWNVGDPSNIEEVYGGSGAITNLTYNITKMEVEYEEITVESGNTGTFLSYWHSDTQPIPRIFWLAMNTNVYPLTTATEQVIQLDIRVKSLQFIVATVRVAADVTNPQINDRYENWYGPDSGSFPLLEYQWELNNNQWPDRPISLSDPGNVQTYKKFLELFGNYFSRGLHMDVTAIGPVEHSTDKFIMDFDANMYPFSPKMIGPISTERSSKYVTLRIKFNSAPPAGLELLVHYEYWRYWLFGAPPGQIVQW